MSRTAKWTPEELQTLRRLASEGRPASAIARIMGRSEPAVRGKAYNNGVALISERCLHCIPLKFETSMQAGR